MAPRRVLLRGFFAALALVGATGGALLVYQNMAPSNAVATPLAFHIPQTSYGPQKVVYHVATRGSWRDRESEAWRLVAVLNNHLNAIEPEEIAIRVIFQGDGIEALKRAKTNPKLASALDGLKKRGVQFRVCANTLEAYRMGLETLHGVTEANLVQAGVAELIHLQQQGYAYLRF